MFNTDTELLFPLRVIPQLADLRGEDWKRLILHLSEEETFIEEKIALTLLMVKLSGCASCNNDSFRAMKGCTQCSKITLKRYKGMDEDLIKAYRDCFNEVSSFLEKVNEEPKECE
jgi:hypothetical protein